MKALALVVGLAACSEPQVVVGQLQELTSLKAIADRDLDLLFVVDNSASMIDNQAALAASFPKMMDVLAEVDGGLPNLHIGIVTSDMGTKGSQVDGPGADGRRRRIPAAARARGDNGLLQHAGLAAAYIEDVANPDGTRQRNYTGELRDVFTTAALVGDRRLRLRAAPRGHARGPRESRERGLPARRREPRGRRSSPTRTTARCSIP